MSGPPKRKQKRGKSWSLKELQIIDDNRHLTAIQLADLLPSRTPSGIAKKRVNRHGRRLSKSAERGGWSEHDEAICREWNVVHVLLNECQKKTRSREKTNDEI
ncbi:hypothetical protein [Leclercia adecarboxylata]|uniref:hypothetical protein n=1 Tax=Leclercia adecarboxylata TaxID=83655 RepID=UPI003D978BB6